MNPTTDKDREPRPPEPRPAAAARETAFGFPRNFLDNRFVYVVVSPRARGLSIGINMNPDKRCDFNCVYCEVNREIPGRDSRLDVGVMETELQQTLKLAHQGKLREIPLYRSLPHDLLEVRHVALSGDGEPTLSPDFAAAVHAVVHVRAQSRLPFFKMVLITNGTWLDLTPVQHGLKSFTKQDEIWVKLDAGTQAYMNKVNRPSVTLDKILRNILALARQRPVIIQSLFQSHEGHEPPDEEIHQYALRLKELKDQGADLALVQIYSANRPPSHAPCDHLPLKTLSRIAQTVRSIAGLNAEVF
ncbi:MAG: radical SAM protein [Verrucomicrobia bacterium]|nr:radical SAM protein [Verrucomicrobiota bacterium]